MQFQPKTGQEIAESRLLPKGEYDFSICDAEEKLSANRNTMIELKIELTPRDGMKRMVKDYLLVQRAEKLRHACEACGLIEKYLAGSLSDDDFVGKRGRLKLGIQKSKFYPDKNVVLDYVAGKRGVDEYHEKR